MSNYYYLDVSLILEEPQEVTVVFFKKNIVEAIKQLFGEVGTASITFDILKYDSEKLRAIIRVPNRYFVKFRGSLTLRGSYEGIKSSYVIHKTAPLLLALQGDSRDYIH